MTGTVLDSKANEPNPSNSSATVDTDGESKPSVYVFNEQTNYVPKSTIITVGTRTSLTQHQTYSSDISGLLDGRPHSFDGSNYAGRQFVHHWQCLAC